MRAEPRAAATPYHGQKVRRLQREVRRLLGMVLGEG
jgi:hypothetical protein